MNSIQIRDLSEYLLKHCSILRSQEEVISEWFSKNSATHGCCDFSDKSIEDIEKILNMSFNGIPKIVSYGELSITFYNDNDEIVINEYVPFSQFKISKPSIYVNGRHVEDGYRNFKLNEPMFIADPTLEDFYNDTPNGFQDTEVDNLWIHRGLAYQSKELAIIRSKAMLDV